MTPVKLTNLFDLERARNGLPSGEEVRTVEIQATVDTGVVSLVLPEDVVKVLGLRVARTQGVRLADGSRRDLPVVAGVLIEILGRTMSCDAVVTPAGSTPLIGQILLEGLDLVVVPGTGKVGPNPANPDGPVYELLGVN